MNCLHTKIQPLSDIFANDQEEQDNANASGLVGKLLKGETLKLIKKGGQAKDHTIYIDDKTAVLPLRKIGLLIDGAFTEAFQKYGAIAQHCGDRCFSIVIGNSAKTIDILCSTPEEKAAWYNGLSLIASRVMPTTQTVEDIARSYFRIADTNKDNRLSLNEVTELLKRLHLNLDQRQVKDLMKMAETGSSAVDQDNQLNRKEFLQFVRILCHCPEIESIYLNAKGKEGAALTLPKFMAFLLEKQSETVTQESGVKLVQKHELSINTRVANSLSYEGFRSYLMSHENSLIKPVASVVYQDMNQPLTSYWIYSSHNSYLIGNQLTGESSTNGYIVALTSGCRCVEIDCWDGSDGDPIVKHGFTLTSNILFKDVIEAIKNAAFFTSPYPVIISLENHCCHDQQVRMAEYAKTIFADLLCPSIVDPSDPTTILSPEALKKKIIFKGHILKSHPYFTHQDPDLIELLDKDGKTAKELSDITAIPLSPMPDLKNDDDITHHHLSIGAVSQMVESVCLGAVEANVDKLVEQTKKYFVRIYPSGLRTGSSNYSPMPAFMGGCQLVSINYQRSDKYLNMYQGFFLDNGCCGYVLKDLASCPLETPQTVTIRVISGYQLGKVNDEDHRDILDPYIIVRMYGCLADMGRQKTAAVKDNGFNPVWNEAFTFNVSRPDIALLRFIVMDENTGKDKFVAEYSVPYRLIRQGYRFCKLNNDNSHCSSLLVHISTNTD